MRKTTSKRDTKVHNSQDRKELNTTPKETVQLEETNGDSKITYVMVPRERLERIKLIIYILY